MAVTFRILPDRGLVYVRYADFAGLEESFRLFAAYTQHPDCRPGQKQLVDLSAVTGFDRDYAKLMKFQALKVGQFVGPEVQTMLAYLAPSRPAHEMALMILRSWVGFDQVIARVFDTEAETLNFLGLPESRIADLLIGVS